MTTQRRPKPSDWLTSRDISDEFGIPVPVADSLIRSMARSGATIHRIEGFRRVWIERGDFEARHVVERAS